MKILSLILILLMVGCANSDYLRKVRVLDEAGNPIKGVERWPREKLFGKGEFSNKKGYIYVVKGGGVLLRDGYIPLKIKEDSKAEVYVLKKNLEGRSWDASEIADIEPSQ